jgi:hypothetical protein
MCSLMYMHACVCMYMYVCVCACMQTIFVGMPPLDADAANVFSQSEHILQEHIRRHNINATELKDLIPRVIHHPEFNAGEVDHDMHQRLMQTVEDSDIEVIDMWEEGDGLQDVTFLKRKVAKVPLSPLPPTLPPPPIPGGGAANNGSRCRCGDGPGAGAANNGSRRRPHLGAGK